MLKRCKFLVVMLLNFQLGTITLSNICAENFVDNMSFFSHRS